MAVPTFGRVIDRSKEEAHAATLQAIAREAQALSAFDQAPINSDIIETAIKDTYYALSSGANAAGAYVPVQSISEDPQFGEIVYAVTPQGAVLSLRLDEAKVCVLGLTSQALGSTLCVPGVASEESSTNTAGDLMSNGDVEVIPGLPATSTPGTPEPTPEPTEPALSIPSPISNLSVIPGNANVTLTWTKPENSKVDSYVITVSPASSKGETFDSNEETFTVSGLSNATTYTFNVSAKNASGASEAKTITATPASNPRTVAKNFNYAGSIVHLDGFMYVADQNNNAVKAVNLETGTTTVLASVTKPLQVATDGTSIYVIPSAGEVYKISVPENRTSGSISQINRQSGISQLFSSQGVVYTVKGSAVQPLSADGVSGAPIFTFQEAGVINNALRGLTRAGDVFHLATDGGIKQYDINTKIASNLSWTDARPAQTVDGPAGVATFSTPHQIDTDGDYIYISGYTDKKIRKVDIRTGFTTTLAVASGASATRSVQVVGDKVYYAPMASTGDLLSVDK